MHPDASRLFALDAALRAEAKEMLAASGIGAILAEAGYHAVGSYPMHTMTWRDLDFERYEEPNWNRHWEVGTQLGRTGWCVRLACTNVYREQWMDYGLYWAVRVASPDRTDPTPPGNPTVWKLDVWTARESEFAPSQQRRAVWAVGLNDDTRSYLLALKEAFCTDPAYRKTMLSVHIYEAVLERGIREVEDFRAWWQETYSNT